MNNSNTLGQALKEAIDQNKEAANSTSPLGDAVSVAANSNVSDQAAAMNLVSNDSLADETQAHVSAYSPEDTTPELELLSMLKGYMLASTDRFKGLLSNPENAASGLLCCLGEALLHLQDHIEQQPVITN